MRPYRLTGGLSLLLALSFFTFCEKKKPNTVPEPDTEVQSSVDASFSTFMVTDIDMISSFVAEGDLMPKFYMQSPESQVTSNSGTTRVYSPGDPDIWFTSFNRTKCLDGRMRDGSVVLDIHNANPNARYYRNYQFVGRITLSDYKVDGWQIKTVDGIPCNVYNQRTGPVFDPRASKLSWLIDGSFEFVHPTDPSKNMTWKGKIVKTIANTSDPNVYNPNGNTAINWKAAIVEYSGEISGTTANGKTFTMKVPASSPITRDFSCFPNKVGGLDPSLQSVWTNEFHPFTGGIAYLKSGDSYQREIYYGSQVAQAAQNSCDNSGEVIIKGIAYRVDFLQ